MRLIILSLAALLVLIQYPLWLGKGGWLRVWDFDKQVAAAQRKNNELKARNAKLNSEVQDLREGTDAVEERARHELGMIKDGEVFIQILEPNGKPAQTSMSDVASRLQAIAAVGRGEQLCAIDRIELVVLAAEITIDRQTAQFCQCSIHFFASKHAQHVADFFARA